MRLAVQPWRDARYSSGRSLEQARSLWIQTREAQLMEEKTGKPIFTVLHDCNSVSYLDYDPEENPEKFKCVCQSPLQEGYSIWVCLAGHANISRSDNYINRSNCKKCDEIENTATAQEKENERKLRIIKLSGDKGIEYDENGRVNPNVHKSDEWVRQYSQAQMFANVESQALKDAITPLIDEIKEIVSSFKEYLNEDEKP